MREQHQCWPWSWLTSSSKMGCLAAASPSTTWVPRKKHSRSKRRINHNQQSEQRRNKKEHTRFRWRGCNRNIRPVRRKLTTAICGDSPVRQRRSKRRSNLLSHLSSSLSLDLLAYVVNWLRRCHNQCKLTSNSNTNITNDGDYLNSISIYVFYYI